MTIRPGDRLVRWRLLLGEPAAGAFAEAGVPALDDEERAADAALEWLYGREHAGGDREIRRSSGDEAGPAGLEVPRWIDAIHRLFPKETVERLERDAVERYAIDEVVTNPEVLARVEPNEVLLQAVLRTKHLMDPRVLGMARQLVARVVRQMVARLARDVRRSFSGPRDPRRRSGRALSRNFDVRATVRANLGRWDATTRRLLIDRPRFFSRQRRGAVKWQIVLLVDQSGSMARSVIHSAVTAACLAALPAVRTHLCAFDTEVVDLTAHVDDPVEALMGVQLGGGTDAARALAYAAQLIESPRRAVVALITDFYEGAGADAMVHRVRQLVEQGTVVLGLAALDDRAEADFDREVAARVAAAGAHVGAMTPGQLVAVLAEAVGA